MILSALVWLLLMLPGYALLRLMKLDLTNCGIMGVLAVAYIGTIALLSPVLICAYLLQWPLAVVSITIAALMFCASLLILSQGWWRDLARILLGSICLELALVLIDLVIGARVGPTYGGDALVHLMHIRALLAEGMSNFHPAYAAEAFSTIYHTNAFYALVASISQLTQADPLDVWWSTLLWAKLVTLGGVYFLGWCVYQNSFAAWGGVLLVGVWLAPATFVLYPNKLAPFWLIAVALGFVVLVAAQKDSYQEALWLGLTTLVLGQIHGMYAVFLGLAAGPFLMGLLLWRLWFGPRKVAHLLAASLALWSAAPFVIASYLATRAPTRSTMVTMAETKAEDMSQKFLQVAEGWVLMWPSGFREIGLLVGLYLGFRGSQKARVLLFFLLTLSGVAWWFNPLQCTLLLRFLGMPWMVQRMPFVVLGFAVLACGGYAYWLEQRLNQNRGGSQPLASR